MSDFFFAIPLAPARDRRQWETVSRLLSHTLRSVLGQTDQDLRVVIAGHERPEIEELQDLRVTFLSSPEPKLERTMQDRERKRWIAMQHIRSRGGGYVMMLDADDLVHRGLVEFIRRDRHPHGYLVERGFMENVATGALSPLPGPRGRPLHQVCGSCAVLHLTPDDIGDGPGSGSFFDNFHEHRRWKQTAARLGRPLATIPFPSVVYRLTPGPTIRSSKEDG